MTLKGQHAELRVGYQVAARMNGYVLVKQKPGVYEFEGTLEEKDEFWLTRGPLELHVFVGTRPWRWSGVTARFDEKRVSASILGEPEL